jgi:hypothetical protein
MARAAARCARSCCEADERRADHSCPYVLKFFPIGAGDIAPSSGMTEYKIILDDLNAYGVEVVSLLPVRT